MCVLSCLWACLCLVYITMACACALLWMCLCVRVERDAFAQARGCGIGGGRGHEQPQYGEHPAAGYHRRRKGTRARVCVFRVSVRVRVLVRAFACAYQKVDRGPESGKEMEMRREQRGRKEQELHTRVQAKSAHMFV